MLSTLLSFGPFVNVAFWIIEKFIAGKAQDKESRKLMLELAKKLREKGVKNAKSMYESALDQEQAGEDHWNAGNNKTSK